MIHAEDQVARRQEPDKVKANARSTPGVKNLHDSCQACSRPGDAHLITAP